MAVVPYTFAGQSGQIPLSELDANFANVKAFAETAGNITGNIQSNITAVGTLTSLSVTGNINAGNIIGNISGNLTVLGANTQVLFNDNGIANATAGMTFNKSTNALSVGGTISAVGNVTGGNIRTSGQISAAGNIIGGNILAFGNGAVVANLIVSSSGEFGIATGQTILSLANNRAETVYIADVRGANIFIGNATSNTSFGGNITATGWIFADALYATSGNIGGGPNVATVRFGNLVPTTVWIGGNASNVGIGNVNSNTQVYGNFITSGNLSVTGTSTLTGSATAPTAANGTSNTQVATTAFVQNSLLNLLPSGVIVMWSGSVASVPTGWFLCNGANSTPDLRDRFIVGAGSTYTPGNTGGSANAIVVSHTHTASSVVTDPGHTHNYNDTVLQADFFGTGSNASTATTSATSSNVTGITVATTVNSTGSSATNANLPPYYALAYIMKA